MTSRHKTETRHHPEGKTCHHFAYHGLTCDQYDELLARAKGHCEICGIAQEETPRGQLVVDHFHGQRGASFIRGMLCDYCNGAVMPCVDGLKVWGASSRKWEARARAYEADSWQAPSPEALLQMAARREMLPKYAPHRRFNREKALAITIPARRGVPAMADSLRKWLTPSELAELVGLLSEEAGDADQDRPA